MDELLRPRLAAQCVLRWWADLSATTPPPAGRRRASARASLATPVDAIVERLGLEVTTFHPRARRSGTLGWLEPGEDLIFLREDLPEPVRRFTLAHELGHAVLHRAAGPPSTLAAWLGPAVQLAARSGAALDLAGGEASDPCDDEDLEAPLDALGLGEEALRPGQAYSMRARREHEANLFAAALLLPPASLRALYLGDENTPGLSPRALAERFGVSEDAVHRALIAVLVPDDAAAITPEASSTSERRLGGSSARPALDRWQQAAAAAEAPALVVAGPGTGKTSTLVGRVAHLVFERGVSPRRILALTFSNKAAQEMRERVATLLADAGDRAHGESSVAEGDLPATSTIHAFCGELLQQYAPLVGLRPGFRVIDEAQGFMVLRALASQMPLTYYQPLAAPALHFPALLDAISRAKDELVDPGRYGMLAAQMAADAQTPEERSAAARALEVARVYAAYQDALEATGDADYGDLIRLAVRLLREQPGILAELRERYAHILVDEFQDINRAMGILLHTLAGADGALWAVGDSDQAIYRFRGASPANLARFTEAYPAARIYPLATNYRSREPILHAAAAVAESVLGGGERPPLEAGRRGLGSEVESGEHPVITVASAADEAAELARLIEAIRSRIAAGREPSDQAVLCRTRRQAQRVAYALSAAGLPARIVTPLLDQPIVKDILSVVLLLTDASGAGLLRAGAMEDHAFTREQARAVLLHAHERDTSPIALPLHGADELAEIPGLTSEGIAGLSRLADTLRELWAAPDVATGLARYVFALTGLARRALHDASGSDGSGSRRAQMGTLARLLTLARDFEQQRRAAAGRDAWQPTGGADWDGFIDYVRVLAALGRDAVGRADEVLAVESDGVRVLTVHASKGLEFPVVYLPGLAAGRFPTQRRGDTTPPPPGLSDEIALEARDPAVHLSEEACLFYVALTRARDELVLSHAERYGRRRYAPSPFLAPVTALARDAASGIVRVRWDGTSLTPPAVPVGDLESESDEALLVADQTRPEALGGREPVVPADEPLRPSAIETYQRCPRQYAYRYVYHLHPHEVGMATLRRSLHETLRHLQARFATPRASAHSSGAAEGTSGAPALAEALEVFEQQWRAAVGAEAAGLRGKQDGALRLDGHFGALYRRHGRQVVERAWLDLARTHGQPRRPEPDVDTPPPVGAPAGPGHTPDATIDLMTPPGERPRTAPVPLTARLEEKVLVRIGGRTIEVTLDRVEGARRRDDERQTAGRRGPITADTAPSEVSGGDAVPLMPPAPVRFVRHQLGRGATGAPSDVRALLYAIAAEQERHGAPPEVFQHNLTTGELERVRLDSRRQARLRDALAETLAGMQSGEYPARPDPARCSSCPFLMICPA